MLWEGIYAASFAFPLLSLGYPKILASLKKWILPKHCRGLLTGTAILFTEVLGENLGAGFCDLTEERQAGIGREQAEHTSKKFGTGLWH